MKQLIRLWHILTDPRCEDKSQARLEYMTKTLLVMMGFSFLLGTLSILAGWIYDVFDFHPLSIILILDIAVIFSYWLSCRGQTRIASYTPVIISLGIGLYFSVVSGTRTSGILFYFFAIVLTAMLQGVKAQWITVGLSTLLHVGIGSRAYPLPLDEFFAAVITFSIGFSGVALLEWFFFNQLEKALAQVIKSEERITNLFNRIPVGLYRTTPEGKITDANPTLWKMLGFQDLESLLEVNANTFYEEPEGRRRFLANGEQSNPIHSKELPLRHLDGSTIWVKDTYRSVQDKTGRVIFYEGSLEDISEQKQAAAALQESEEKFRNLAEKSPNMIFINLGGKIVFANQICEEVMGYTREELLAPEFDFTNLVAAESLPIVREKFRLHIQGLEVEPYEYQIVTKDGDRLDVINTTRMILYAGKPAILGIVTDITERVRAEEQVKRQVNELRILNEVAQASSEVSSTNELIERVTHIVGEMFYPDHFGILVTNGDGETLQVHSSYHGIGEAEPQQVIPFGKGITGQVAATRQPARISDVAHCPEFIPSTPGIRSELCVPICTNGRIIGVINAESKIVNAFSAEDERLLTTIASQLSTAHEKLRLFEETRRNLEHLIVLREIDQAITANLDLEPVLNILIEQATEQLQVDAASILLYDHEAQSFDIATRRGFRTQALVHTHLSMGEGYAGRAALERRIINVADLAQSLDGLKRSPLLEQEGFVCYYAAPLIAKGEVLGILELFHRSRLSPNQEWVDFLTALSTQAALAIDNAKLVKNLQLANCELVDSYDKTIEGWSRALELRDKETEGHSQRVTELALLLARSMGIEDGELVHIWRGTLLHDIGKMGVPDQILFKPGPLSEAEWEIMRQHPTYAYNLLGRIPYLKPALDIPYCHHEKWDGSGYPRKLKGEKIPLAARIFAVVDVWDALRSERPYRPAWSREKALEYIADQRGTHFDPQVVDVFMDLIRTTKCD